MTTTLTSCRLRSHVQSQVPYLNPVSINHPQSRMLAQSDKRVFARVAQMSLSLRRSPGPHGTDFKTGHGTPRPEKTSSWDPLCTLSAARLSPTPENATVLGLAAGAPTVHSPVSWIHVTVDWLDFASPSHKLRRGAMYWGYEGLARNRPC